MDWIYEGFASSVTELPIISLNDATSFLKTFISTLESSWSYKS